MALVSSPTGKGGIRVSERIRFVHAADLHLDAPFKGVDATDRRVGDALIASTYDALDALVEVCLERHADFLVIAGDVYNARERSLRAEFAFRDACVRLADAGIAVFVARGNHDPANSRSAGLSLPESVHVFSENEVERIVFEREGRPRCAVYGRSFRTAAESANLAAGFRRDPADGIAVGVLHANVGGRTDYEPYAPCSLEDLKAARMDYWALGHIHKPEMLSALPPIVYSGCTQGLTPNESGIRGCRVVTVGPEGAESEFVATSGVVWERGTIPAEGLERLEDVLAGVGAAIDALARSSGERPVIGRLALEGRSRVHTELARPGVLADLLAEVRDVGMGRDPWVWVDRIEDRTRPSVDIATLREGEDFAGDLVRLADEVTADERALLSLVGNASASVLGALDARDVPDIDAAGLLERARDLAIDRLLAEEDR